jgi:DNA polymerase III sliding clamp (beta) subunit (PCNA family)
MKITLKRDVFLKKIGLINANISSKSTMPIYDQALVFFKEDKLFMKSTNSYHALEILIPFEGFEGEKVSFVCDTILIQKVFSNFKAEDVFIELSDQKVLFGGLHLKKKYEVGIYYQPEDFPIIDAEDTTHLFSIKGGLFSESIKKASVFTIPDDVTAFFRGVIVSVKKDKLLFQGTNKLVMCSIAHNIESDQEKIFVLDKQLNAISDVFTTSTELKVSINAKETSLGITDGINSVHTRLIEVLRKDPIEPLLLAFSGKPFVRFEREELIMAIKRLSVMANQAEPFVKMSFNSNSNDICLIETSDVDFNRKGDEEIPVVITNQLDAFIKINTNYLLSTLMNLQGDQIFMSIENEKSFPEFKGSSDLGYDTSFFISPIV